MNALGPYRATSNEPSRSECSTNVGTRESSPSYHDEIISMDDFLIRHGAEDGINFFAAQALNA